MGVVDNAGAGAAGGSMFGPYGAAIGAVLGLGKYFLADKPAEERSRKTRAAEIRYSPWTKLAPTTEIKDANLMGGVMQGGVTGAAMGQGLENQEQANKLIQAQINALNSGRVKELSLGGTAWERPAAPTGLRIL